MIVSETVFLWFVTIVLGGTSALWLVRDVFFFRRSRREESDPMTRRDKVFGAVMGMTLGAIGVAGVLRYHLGL